jgi:hypothetical protein
MLCPNRRFRSSKKSMNTQLLQAPLLRCYQSRPPVRGLCNNTHPGTQKSKSSTRDIGDFAATPSFDAGEG